MTIFQNNMKRILRSKLNLLIMIIAPIILIGLLLTISSGKESVPVGMVDKDHTPLTKLLIEDLNKRCKLKLVNEDSLNYELITGKLEYIFVIESGFTQDLIDQKHPQIKGISIGGANRALPVKANVDMFYSAVKGIAQVSDGNSEKFYDGLNQYIHGGLGVRMKSFDKPSAKGNLVNVDAIVTILGFLLMFMLFLPTFATMIMIKDRESRAFYRVLSTPMTLSSYMMQSILSFFLISLLQIMGILLIMRYVFLFDFGPLAYTFRLFVVLTVFSLVCVAFGVAVSSLAKSARHASAIASLVISPICMLGGCFWPVSSMPQFLQALSNFVPTRWVLIASRGVIEGKALLKVSGELGILMLFALMLFLIASSKRWDAK